MAVKRNKLADRISIGRRYVRSVDLGRDLTDPHALSGYVITPAVRDALQRILNGLRNDSTQRAFRVTGPYGVGKSAFGLLLAKFFQDRLDGKSGSAAKLLRTEEVPLPGVPKYFPIVVIGRRANFADCLLAELTKSARTLRGAKASAFAKDCEALAKSRAKGTRNDMEVLDLLRRFASELNTSGGVLLLVDEMGRFLEYAALHRQESDPSFFQQLAERAGGVQKDPLAVVAFLHHRFADYAAGLGEWVEAEWVRSAERYEDVSLHDSTEQTAFLLAEAIVHRPAEEGEIATRAQKLYSEAAAKGVFTTRKSELAKIGPRLFPLHPAAVACLANIAGRFGQNERSVFSFLHSLEPHGFQRFIHANPHSVDVWYSLADLYDYVAALGDVRFRSADRERRWELLRNAVAEGVDLQELPLRALKCVGLLAVLEPTPGLRADPTTVAWCLDTSVKETEQALKSLVERKLLYVRAHRDDYSLWASTSVDLDGWLEKARTQTPQVKRLDSVLAALPPARPLVAHKHYHRTGTLRAFTVSYWNGEGDATLKIAPDCDGTIVVVPVYPDQSLQAVGKDIISRTDATDELTLYCVRQITPSALAAAWDLALWRWIEQNCGDLRVDDLARREVRGRIEAASDALQSALEPFGRLSLPGSEEIWIYRGKALDIADRSLLNRKLSDICDKVFADGPILRNELINRSRLSSAAASARMRLLEAMVQTADQPYLGFTGAPPERTVYLSLFQSTNIHRQEEGHWSFLLPSPDDKNWGPVWKKIEAVLQERGYCTFEEISAELAKPPIGLRAGPALPMIAAFMLYHRRQVAVFERNSFQPELSAAHFMRLAKSPANFALKYLGTSQSASAILERLSTDLDIWPDGAQPEASLRPVVEALYRWWQAIPAYGKETGTVSKHAQAIRTALKKAYEPIDLIYIQLPQACDLPAMEPEAYNRKQADTFVELLNISFQEISDASERVRSEAQAALLEAFGARTIEKLRTQIGNDYGRHTLKLTDYRLRAFIDRATDSSTGDQAWLDGVGSLLTGKRIDAWKDDTIDNFIFEARAICARLARWLAHMKLEDADSVSLVSVHVVDTTGHEDMVVVRKGTLTKETADKVTQIKKMLASAKDPSSVLAHVMADQLKKPTKEPKERTDG
ncbi:hypothetical protein [Bradyrhizobium sp. USDA 223]|uniref:hypothetical protein n=1 Tax=Bradyrhizobium sp. USDA 223 TaxID=3156306 RepID=UPI0038351C15